MKKSIMLWLTYFLYFTKLLALTAKFVLLRRKLTLAEDIEIENVLVELLGQDNKPSLVTYEPVSKGFLTDQYINSLTPKAKRYKVLDNDATGLFLVINPDGVKQWKIKTIVANKKYQHVIGIYPHLTIENARSIAQKIKQNG